MTQNSIYNLNLTDKNLGYPEHQQVIGDLIHNKFTIGSYFNLNTLILLIMLLVVLAFRKIKNETIYEGANSNYDIKAISAVSAIPFTIWAVVDFFFRMVTVAAFTVFIMPPIVYFCTKYQIGDQKIGIGVVRNMGSPTYGLFGCFIIYIGHFVCVFVPRPYIFFKYKFKSGGHGIKFNLFSIIPIIIAILWYYGLFTSTSDSNVNIHVKNDGMGVLKFFKLG